MRAALALAALLSAGALAGCTTASTASFEEDFDAGRKPAYEQASPTWRSPGLFDALPAEGAFRGFSVESTEGPEMAVLPAGTPTRFGFRDEALDESWGAYSLRLVRWRDWDRDEPRRSVLFLVEPEGIQGWGGAEVPADDLRARFRELADSFVPLPHDEREAMEEAFVESRRGLRMAEVPGTEPTVEGFHHFVPYQGELRLEEVFGALGGFGAFTPVARHQATFLPSPGQIDLVQGPWEFYFQTPMLRAVRGPFGDREIVLVTPDDSVQYVHWGEGALDDAEAGLRLREAIRDLGHEPPDTAGWAFTHTRHEGGPGD